MSDEKDQQMSLEEKKRELMKALQKISAEESWSIDLISVLITNISMDAYNIESDFINAEELDKRLDNILAGKDVTESKKIIISHDSLQLKQTEEFLPKVRKRVAESRDKLAFILSVLLKLEKFAKDNGSGEGAKNYEN